MLIGRGRRARRARPIVFLLLFLIPVAVVVSASANPIVIGSKKFTESYVLGEIARRRLTDAGIPAEHREGMRGTIILWHALGDGQIADYAQDTGPVAEGIVKS